MADYKKKTAVRHYGYLGHEIPLKTYFGIYFMLMILLFLTFEVANYDFGKWNTVIAMTVAVVKTLLVILYFMHVKYSGKVVKLLAGSGFFWLIILFILTFGDYLTRKLVPVFGWGG